MFEVAIMLKAKSYETSDIHCRDNNFNRIFRDVSVIIQNMRTVYIVCLFVAFALAWDYFTFSLQWSVRKNGKCEGDRFTIHGLWPDDINGSYPAFCPPTDFNISLLDDLIPQLNVYWPSEDGSNTAFWRHEYEKHGSCAVNDGVFDDQREYFVAALDLAARYSDAFNSTWPVPSNEKPYSSSAITDALTYRWNVSANVACVGAKMLSEVRLCFSKMLEITDCYQPREDFCADYVYLPKCAQ